MKTKNIYLFGHGDEAMIVSDIISNNPNLNLCGFFEVLDDKLRFHSMDGKIFDDVDLNDYLIENIFFCIAIGFNYDRFLVHKYIITRYPNILFTSIISDTAKIRPNVLIGEGCVIHDNVYINRGTVIGKHCIINNNSSIDHDCIWDDFSSCGPVVVTGGRIHVGSLSYVGMSSVVLQRVLIGNSVVIGAKSLVNIPCENNSLYFGTGIKFIKKISDDFNYFN